MTKHAKNSEVRRIQLKMAIKEEDIENACLHNREKDHRRKESTITKDEESGKNQPHNQLEH